MEATTPGVILLSEFTWDSNSGLDIGEKDFNFWTLSGLNFSNISEAGVYGDSTEGPGTNREVQKEVNVSEWDDLWRGIPLGIVLACLCLLTTIGNIMVLYAVRTEKRLQTVSNLFIVSLAVADVIVGIIVMPMNAFYIFTERWMLGVAVCQIWIGVDYTASTASILNLFILSLDRYWSVRQPLKYLHKRTKRRAFSMIAVVWAVSSLWVIPISSWHYFAHSGNRTVPNDVCDTEYAKNSFFKLITAFFNFYLPLSVMYILYFRIFIAIRKRSEFELGQRNSGAAVLSFKSTIANSVDDSEYNDDLSCSVDQTQAGESKIKENGARPHLPQSNRNHRILAVKRPPVPSHKDSNSTPYKVEYIYDENVIDPQTEKIERYYYEDHYPSSCLSPRPTWIIGNDRYSLTNPRPGFLRSQRQLGDFKVSPKFQAMPSLAGCSSNSNGPIMNDDYQLQKYLSVGKKQNAVVKRSLFRRQKKSNVSALRAQSTVRPVSYGTSVPEETSFTPSFYIDPTNVSSSSSSSASTFGERRSDDGGKRVCSVYESRSGREGVSDNGRPEILDRIPRDNFSVLGAIRKIRQAESFLDKTSGLGIASCNSMDGSSSRTAEDPEGVIVLRDDKNRRLTSGMTSLRERLKTIRQSSSLNKEIKAARQLGVIMGAFTLCFLPYFILFLVVAFCDDCVKQGHLTAATWVGYLNSTLNPFLYPLCNANFRNKFRRMLSCCCKQRRSRLHNTQQDFMERNTGFNSRYD